MALGCSGAVGVFGSRNTGLRAWGVGVPILLTTGTIKIRVRESINKSDSNHREHKSPADCYDHTFRLLGLLVRHNHQCEGNSLERPSRASKSS